MPILFLIIFGIIQYGFYFFAYQGGSDAARSAARLSAVGNPVTCTAFRTAVTSDMPPNSTNVLIKRTFEKNSLNRVEIGRTVTVTISFQSPDLGVGFLPSVKDGKITSTAKSRVEYVNNGQPQDCT